MKVALKDIKPNPWRYINKGYPIDKAKVEKLRSSIKRTGFWDNLVARKGENGYVEIAYGHHRIEALRQEFDKNHEIDVIMRDLDDAAMLKIMAAENDAMDVMSPAVINETVRATREFLKDSICKWEQILKKVSATHDSAFCTDEERALMKKAKAKHLGTIDLLICEFLDWPGRRVTEAMSALRAIEKSEVDKEEYESLTNQKHAEAFRREIIKEPLPKSKRMPIIEKLKNQEIGTKQIRKEILKAKFPNGKDKERDIMLDDVADKIAARLRECTVLMTDEFVSNAKHLSNDSATSLASAYKAFVGRLHKLKGQKRVLIGAEE